MLLRLYLFFILGLVIAKDALSEYSGVLCTLVKTGKNPAYINVELQSHNSFSKEETVFPIFILRYTDLLNIKYLPNALKYLREFTSSKPKAFSYIVPDDDTFHPEDRNKFIVEYLKDDLNTINEGLTKEKSIHYPVKEDGYYCIYIAQPLTVSEFRAAVTIRNSYGNLPYTNYSEYKQKWVLFFLSIIVFAYLLYFVISKVGKDFSNLNSLSLISRATIFYILLPFILITGYNLLLWWIFNNFISSSSDNWIFNVLNFFSYWLNLNFLIFYKYSILIFSMGFGTIYYLRGNTKGLRELPQSLHRYSWYLLVGNIIFNGLVSTRFFRLDNSVMVVDSISISFIGILSVLSMTWTILSSVYYFKTKKIIKKFPPISNSPDSVDLNEGILRSFRSLIIIIFFLPVVIHVVGGIFLALSSKDSIIDYSKLPSSDQDPDGDVATILFADSIENSYFNGTVDVLSLSLSLDILLPIIGIYAIWIRSNFGMIVKEDENGDGYRDVDQFVISDDEDEESEESDDFDDGLNETPPVEPEVDVNTNRKRSTEV